MSDVDLAVALSRELLHGTGALRVSVALDGPQPALRAGRAHTDDRSMRAATISAHSPPSDRTRAADASWS